MSKQETRADNLIIQGVANALNLKLLLLLYNLTQKVSKCKNTCYVQAFIEEEPEACVTVTMFQDLLHTLGFPDDHPLTEDIVTNGMLSLPRVKISYNRKTKLVSSVQGL